MTFKLFNFKQISFNFRFINICVNMLTLTKKVVSKIITKYSKHTLIV